ncbi:MAG: hypothetical protein O7E52_25430 [Candidatus Poribacteria bacterium]|nr:hypothetical protein [Candidatus Poribacteria bacterium]
MSRPEFDLFMKLDADMVLMRENVLEEIVEYFSNRRELDHAVFSVRDFASDSDILGLHVFSNRATWPICSERLFVDPDPSIPGLKEYVWGPPAPVAHHSPNPSEGQLFSFGVHRATKVIQIGRTAQFRTMTALVQWKLLLGVAQKFMRKSERRLLFALYGAELVRRREIVLFNDSYKGVVASEHFEAARQMSTPALKHECAFWFGSRKRQLLWWAMHVGWRACVGAAKRNASRMVVRSGR